MANKPDLVQQCIDLNLKISDLTENKVDIDLDIRRIEELNGFIQASMTLSKTKELIA